VTTVDTERTITFTVNGVPREATVPVRRLLSDALRHDLGLTGTHVGCEHGVCGACTVLVDGTPMRSCLMLAVQADGRNVETVEGLSRDGRLSVMQEAFRRHHALQCGFCTAGILMSLDDYLGRHPAPTEDEIRVLLSGHLCRCTGYTGIVRAALEAAQIIREEKRA